MKTIQKLICILALFGCAAIARVPMEAQSIAGPGATALQQTGGMPWQFGGDWKFNSSSTATPGFDVRGISYYRVLWVPVGTVSACSLSIDSAAAVDPVLGTLTSPVIGGIVSAATLGSCATAGTYVSAAAAGVSAYGQITPTITGSGSVIVVVFGYTENPTGGGSASSGDYTVNGNLLFSPNATYIIGGSDGLHAPQKIIVGNTGSGQILISVIGDGSISQAQGVLTAQNGYLIVKAEGPFGSTPWEPGFQFVANNGGVHGQAILYIGQGLSGGSVASDATTAFVIADVSSNVQTDFMYVGHGQGIGFEQHFNQGSWVDTTGVASQSNRTAGTCAMSAGTTCTFSLVTAFTATPICIATAQGTNITGGAVACSVSGTTVTVTAASSNSNTWGALLIGNPN